MRASKDTEREFYYYRSYVLAEYNNKRVKAFVYKKLWEYYEKKNENKMFS